MNLLLPVELKQARRKKAGRMRPMQILPKIKNIPIETGMSSIRTQAMRTR